MRWWPSRRRDEDLARELRSDLDLEAEEQQARGLSEEVARAAAGRAFGNAILIREQVHEVWGTAWFERLLQDVHYARRQIAKSPGFASVCLVTLALGIGANTAMFSVMQGVILAPLPFEHADRLVFLWENRPGVPQLDVSYPNFEDWRRNSRSFESMTALTIHNYDLTAPGSAEHLVGIRASSGLLTALGVAPAIGLDITPSEDQPNAPRTALISDRVWRERFASDPRVAGRSLIMDGKSFTVVGVLPAGFHFLTEADVITSLRPDMPVIYSDRSVDALAVMGRLKPDLAIAAALAEMNAIQQELDRRYPDANRGVGVSATSLMQQIIGDVKGTIFLLYGAVSLVLLITCANVANLMLARSTARAREFGIRAALGASRGRIARQLLTETVVLSLAGGALGTMFAALALRLLLAVLPHTLPRSGNIGLHLPVLLFTALASIAVGLLFGVAPALRCANPEVHAAVQKASRGTTAGSHPLIGHLVVVQFALTLVLMTGSGLLLRSVQNLSHVNPGFDTGHVISFQVGLSPSSTKSPAQTRAAYQQLLQRIREAPGVEAADLTNIVPLSGADNGGPFWIGTRQPASLQEVPHALYFWTGPDYLKTMGIPLLEGRFFGPADQIGSVKVVVIDRVLAQAFFPGQSPVGQTLTVGHWGAARVIGVVEHVRHWGLDDPGTYNPRQIYIPVYQLPDSMVTDFFRTLKVVVRTRLPFAELMPAMRSTVYASSPDQPVYSVKTMDELVSESMASRNLPIVLLGTFAVLGFLLSSIGIYGVVSYSVVRRTPEIGICMALGADRWTVFRMVITQGMSMAFTGLSIGVLGAVVLVRILPSFSHLLYGVGQSDAPTLLGVSGGLLLVALIACYLPARRAMRTDPANSLRWE
jgi:predicted permease